MLVWGGVRPQANIFHFWHIAGVHVQGQNNGLADPEGSATAIVLLQRPAALILDILRPRLGVFVHAPRIRDFHGVHEMCKEVAAA